MRGLLEVHEKLAGKPALDGGAGAAARLAADVGPCEGGLRHEVRRVPKTSATAALLTDSLAFSMAVIPTSSREIASEIDRSWRCPGAVQRIVARLAPANAREGERGAKPRLRACYQVTPSMYTFPV
jgi:hypothetical protein